MNEKILPGTGRGTARRVVEGPVDARTTALLSGILDMSCCAPEVEVELRGWWPVSGVLWRRLWIGGEVEGGHQRDFEAGDEGFGASLVHGSGGLAEQAEQQIGDQGGVNLGFDGVFGSPEEAFDLEVLLDPFEQQFDLPALLVECCDLAGRAVVIIGDERERGLALAFDGDFAQIRALQGVACAPARYRLADAHGRIAEDAVTDWRVRFAATHFRVALEPRDKDRACGVDPLPPAKVEITLVKNIGGARINADRAPDRDVADLSRRNLGPVGHVCARIIANMQLQPAHPRFLLGPRKTQVAQGDRAGIYQLDQRVCATAQLPRCLTDQRDCDIAEHFSGPFGKRIAERRPSTSLRRRGASSPR